MNESSDSDTDPMLTPPEGVSPTRENNVKQFTDRSLQSDINDTVKICKLQRPITVDLEDLSDEECTTPPMVTPSEGVMPEFANSPSLKITKVLQKLSFSDIQNAPKSVLSPTSPSSVFSKSVIAAMDDCILDGVLLSQWDNILGPRIRHLWLTSSPQGFTLDMLNHVATQTLCGDICRDPESPHIDTKLYIVKEKNIVIHTFIFGAMGKADLAVHSLSLIIALAEYTSYLQVHNLCSTWMHRLLAKLRVLLEKVTPPKLKLLCQKIVAVLATDTSNFLFLIYFVISFIHVHHTGPYVSCHAEFHSISGRLHHDACKSTPVWCAMLYPCMCIHP